MAVVVYAQPAISAIGSWREHYNNHSIIDIAKGDQLYVASPHQIISIDANQKLDWIGKAAGLQQSNINHTSWDANQKQLIVTYLNGAIDIIKGDQVIAINDIATTNLYASHQINHIYLYQNYALLSTDFGIVVVDLLKYEIKDTWFPNNSRQATKTYSIGIYNGVLFAATENGMASCLLKNNWINNGGWNNINVVGGNDIQQIETNTNSIIGFNKSSIVNITNNKIIYTANEGKINAAAFNNTAILLAVQYPSKKGAVLSIDNNIASTIIDTNTLQIPKKIWQEQGQLWIADSVLGLLQKNTSTLWLNLGGPLHKIGGEINTQENNLIAPFDNNEPGVALFNGEGWKNFTKIQNKELLTSHTAVINPQDHSWWLGATNGLQHISQDAAVYEWVPAIVAGEVVSTQIDAKGIIWALQDNQGILKGKDKTWKLQAIPVNFLHSGLRKMILTQNGQAWIKAPNNQGIYVYQSADILSTELWKQITPLEGNLPSANVTSMAETKDGSIWVGTDNGIAIFEAQDFSKTLIPAYLPKVKNNGFYGYLFQKETVNSIAIDDANRKWIGTNNGAWLLTEDVAAPNGFSIIQHFTKENSPLPSDTITQIVINHVNGEVFFNTTQEMVSFRGTATQGTAHQSNMQIFPNPVPPNFNGLIAIKGLVDNGIVKITNLSGQLVFQTRALGGQAIWNGKTYEGQPVSAGVYLVIVRDDAGTEKGVGKIMITNGF